jgi:hypothetical protein
MNQATDDADTDFVTDQHRQALLHSSTDYMQAKIAFQIAIAAAREAGMDYEEIARVTGLTVPMIAAVLRAS